MKVIGLCGESGSGKGSVTKILNTLGIVCVDTDAVYHDMISAPSACLSDIVAHFGTTYLTDNGALDRKKLAATVFSDKNELAYLNKISHKHILAFCREVIKKREAAGDRFIVIDAPLLFESGFDSECDVIIAVTAPKEVRLSRIMMRDGIDEGAAIRRIEAQTPLENYIGKTDYVICNDSDKETLKIKTLEIIDRIKKESGKDNDDFKKRP